MAERYARARRERVFNSVITPLLRVGLGPPGMVLLTVRGRKTGRRLTLPVAPLEYDGRRYLVSPYGERAWTKNARAAGKVVLSRGRRHEAVGVAEVGASEAAPVLRQYIQQNRIVRPYFDATPGSTTEEFVAEAPRHPVFRIEAAPSI